MRQINSSDRGAVEPLFSEALYQNTHLGWLEPWDLGSGNGGIFYDASFPKGVLIFLQPEYQNTVWLHSFFSNNDPDTYDLAAALKKCLVQGSFSLYAISSHNWYSDLLIKNGFRQCDRIIQMETDNIAPLSEISVTGQYQIEREDMDGLHESCEPAFPPIWRLNKYELSLACREADYKMCIRRGGEYLGYIIASIEPDHCHIMRIAVNPAHLRQGIGIRMISSLLAECRRKDIRNFSVNTNEKNSAAVHLYQSLNLKTVGKTYPLFNRQIFSSR